MFVAGLWAGCLVTGPIILGMGDQNPRSGGVTSLFFTFEFILIFDKITPFLCSSQEDKLKKVV
jgi:hypothetical protein